MILRKFVKKVGFLVVCFDITRGYTELYENAFSPTMAGVDPTPTLRKCKKITEFFTQILLIQDVFSIGL